MDDRRIPHRGSMEMHGGMRSCVACARGVDAVRSDYGVQEARSVNSLEGLSKPGMGRAHPFRRFENGGKL